jgi:hypothetical protein
MAASVDLSLCYLARLRQLPPYLCQFPLVRQHAKRCTEPGYPKFSFQLQLEMIKTQQSVKLQIQTRGDLHGVHNWTSVVQTYACNVWTAWGLP